MAKFAKSVSFNEKNEDDKAILKHVARRNFSGYVKKLILEDIKRKEEKKQKESKKDERKEEIKEEVKVSNSVEKNKPLLKINTSGSDIKINSGNLKMKD